MRCKYKRFDKIKLCPSDLTHFISIKSRSIVGDKPGTVGQTTLSSVAECWASVETVSPFKTAQGLGLDEKVTHVWYMRLDDVGLDIDPQIHVVDDGTDLFRIMSVEDLGAFKETLALYSIVRKSGNEAYT